MALVFGPEGFEMDKRIMLALTAVAILAVAIVVFNQTPPAVQPLQTLKIGGAFGLTGFAQTWGEVELKGTQLAVEEINANGGINGQTVELVVEDTRSENASTVTAVTKLIEVDNVKAVIGPTWLDTYGAASPLSESKNTILFTPSGASTTIQNPVPFKNAFSTWYRVDFESKRLVEYMKKSGYKKIAVFYGNEPYWADFAGQIKTLAPQNGLEIIGEYALPVNDPDFRTTLVKIKSQNPDAVVFGFNGTRELLSLMQQRQVLYPQSKFFSLETIEEFAFDPDFNGVLNNIWYAAPALPDESFRQKYKDRFGSEASLSANNAYDAARILLESIKKAGTDTTAIRNYLSSNEFDSVTFGKIRFDELNGPKGGRFVIKQIQDSQIQLVEEAQ